jgi:hypothetical protein
MFRLAVADKAAYPGLHAAGEHTFNMLVTAVEDCQSAGLIAEGDARIPALFAWSTVHGLSTLAVENQLEGKALPACSTELADALTDRIILGLRHGG